MKRQEDEEETDVRQHVARPPVPRTLSTLEEARVTVGDTTSSAPAPGPSNFQAEKNNAHNDSNNRNAEQQQHGSPIARHTGLLPTVSQLVAQSNADHTASRPPSQLANSINNPLHVSQYSSQPSTPVLPNHSSLPSPTHLETTNLATRSMRDAVIDPTKTLTNYGGLHERDSSLKMENNNQAHQNGSILGYASADATDLIRNPEKLNSITHQPHLQEFHHNSQRNSNASGTSTVTTLIGSDGNQRVGSDWSMNAASGSFDNFKRLDIASNSHQMQSPHHFQQLQLQPQQPALQQHHQQKQQQQHHQHQHQQHQQHQQQQPHPHYHHQHQQPQHFMNAPPHLQRHPQINNQLMYQQNLNNHGQIHYASQPNLMGATRQDFAPATAAGNVAHNMGYPMVTTMPENTFFPPPMHNMASNVQPIFPDMNQDATNMSQHHQQAPGETSSTSRPRSAPIYNHMYHIPESNRRPSSTYYNMGTTTAPAPPAQSQLNTAPGQPMYQTFEERPLTTPITSAYTATFFKALQADMTDNMSTTTAVHNGLLTSIPIRDNPLQDKSLMMHANAMADIKEDNGGVKVKKPPLFPPKPKIHECPQCGKRCRFLFLALSILVFYFLLT